MLTNLTQIENEITYDNAQEVDPLKRILETTDSSPDTKRKISIGNNSNISEGKNEKDEKIDSAMTQMEKLQEEERRTGKRNPEKFRKIITEFKKEVKEGKSGGMDSESQRVVSTIMKIENSK
jgi:hypothetical protein